MNFPTASSVARFRKLPKHFQSTSKTLPKHIQIRFPDFPAPYLGAEIRAFVYRVCDLGLQEISTKLERLTITLIAMTFPRRSYVMNARPQIREKLLEIKMNHWLLVARCPSLSPRCPTSRARRNYWKLCSKHPAVMQRLGLNECSVYK